MNPDKLFDYLDGKLSPNERAKLEERFLRGELGPAYDDYARRVPMLVPFTPA